MRDLYQDGVKWKQPYPWAVCILWTSQWHLGWRMSSFRKDCNGSGETMLLTACVVNFNLTVMPWRDASGQGQADICLWRLSMAEITSSSRTLLHIPKYNSQLVQGKWWLLCLMVYDSLIDYSLVRTIRTRQVVYKKVTFCQNPNILFTYVNSALVCAYRKYLLY